MSSAADASRFRPAAMSLPFVRGTLVAEAPGRGLLRTRPSVAFSDVLAFRFGAEVPEVSLIAVNAALLLEKVIYLTQLTWCGQRRAR